MKTFKTDGGLELPFLSLKGKDYLQVQHRIVWFRSEKPDWSIETRPIELTKDYAIFKAEIKDPQGRIIATGTKSEHKVSFADYIEKAESGSVGRALAFLGYGTAFAQELDEGDRLADAPQYPKPEEKKLTPEKIKSLEAQFNTNKIDSFPEKVKQEPVQPKQFELLKKAREDAKLTQDQVKDLMRLNFNKEDIKEMQSWEINLLIAMIVKKSKEGEKK